MRCFAMSIAVAVLFAIFALVVYAIQQGPPQVEEEAPIDPKPSEDWLKTQYQTTTSLYIEVDREIWQVATIFVTASLLLMGWVVSNFEKLSPDLVFVLGCASITLVGIATLFKHRLREFNIVHIGFLRRLEKAVSPGMGAAEFWGMHHVRKVRMRSKGNMARLVRSIHFVMDLYFFIFSALWSAIWVLSLRHGG